MYVQAFLSGFNMLSQSSVDQCLVTPAASSVDLGSKGLEDIVVNANS